MDWLYQDRGRMDRLYWDRASKWTSYTGTEQVNGQVILGQ